VAFLESLVREAGHKSLRLLGKWQSDIVRQYLSTADHQSERQVIGLALGDNVSAAAMHGDVARCSTPP
jgi:hypothetical protein